MHYLTLVAVPPGTRVTLASVEKLVGKALAPFREELRGHHNPRGWWDYWQIGGRWTGLLDGYDPDDDPELHETCPFCDGVGVRVWREGPRECNGCAGSGARRLWPSQWPLREGDWARLGDVRSRAALPAYLVADGMCWDEKPAIAGALASLSDDCAIIVVDVLSRWRKSRPRSASHDRARRDSTGRR